MQRRRGVHHRSFAGGGWWGYGVLIRRFDIPAFVARELAHAGLRSGPKNLTTIAGFCECYALKREQAPSPQVSQHYAHCHRFRENTGHCVSNG
ncbi:hypothetical protein EMIT0194MI4_60311 [Pseudomonas sp. IT-194MI4]